MRDVYKGGFVDVTLDSVALDALCAETTIRFTIRLKEGGGYDCEIASPHLRALADQIDTTLTASFTAAGIKRQQHQGDLGVYFIISAAEAADLVEAIEYVRRVFDSACTFSQAEFWYVFTSKPNRHEAYVVVQRTGDIVGMPTYVFHSPDNALADDNEERCEQFEQFLRLTGLCSAVHQGNDPSGFRTFEVGLTPEAQADLLASLTKLVAGFPVE